MHSLLKSRENGATDEGICLNASKWPPGRITAEASNERLETAYFRDGLRKLGILNLYGPVDTERLHAIGDVLLRWSAFPGTSMYLCGAHGAGKAVYESMVSPKTFDIQEQYHAGILSAIGPVVHHPNFAYAMDVEAPGKVDPAAKKIAQGELIGRIRKRWPSLFFLCSTRNWSNPWDLIGYELPADNCAARICFYGPFVFTHWNDKEIGLDAPVPYPLTQKQADEIIRTSPRLTAWGREQILEAVGFNKASMLKVLRECKATGIPFVITEAGVYKVPANAKYAERWRADLRSACYSEGVALMEYAWGFTEAEKGAGFGLGIGL